MQCHICQREAVDRCYNCGELFCERHGQVNCQRCETGILPGDGRDDRVSARPLAKTGRPGWWRPVPAEDYDPPACHECHGLARQMCTECGKHYCPEHAGKNGRCAACQRDARSSNVFLVIIFGIFAALFILASWRIWVE